MRMAPDRAGSSPPSGSGEARQVSLGRYDLLFRIASGGMAEVHAGRARGEAGFEKLVAIKRMHPHLAEDEHFVDMFLDEARVASHVTSPHVVQTLDLGRADDGSLFLVMELVLGQSLSMLLRALEKRGGVVPLPIALEILAQAAQGLDDAHEASTATGVALGIVHRDVSPQNLLVGLDGRTRVTDFGIARALLRRTSTSTGELKGKIAYFSPEQACATDVDRRSDIFALGIVAWETVTGQRLFKDGEALLTLRRLIEESVPNPRTVRPDIPVPVAQVILRALCREPAGRWQTAAEMATALRDAAQTIGRAPTAKEIGRWVADVGGDKVRSIRDRIDAAINGPAREIDEDAATTLLLPGAAEPASGVVPRPASSASAISVDIVTEPPIGVPRAGAEAKTVVLPAAIHSPGLSDDEDFPRPRGRGRAIAVAVLAVAAVGGVFWLGRASSDTTTSPATPASTASAAPVSDPTPPDPAPAASASAAKSADVTPSAPILAGKGKTRPGDRAQKVAAPDPPSTPPPLVKVADPAPPPATTPTPKTGPLLGDDAFNRDVSRKH